MFRVRSRVMFRVRSRVRFRVLRVSFGFESNPLLPTALGELEEPIEPNLLETQDEFGIVYHCLHPR
jgi:hypothetical protein